MYMSFVPKYQNIFKDLLRNSLLSNNITDIIDFCRLLLQ